MSFIFLPFTFIDISVSFDEASLAVGLVLNPVAFVDCTVGPDLSAPALPCLGACEPLSFVRLAACVFVEILHRSALKKVAGNLLQQLGGIKGV